MFEKIGGFSKAVESAIEGRKVVLTFAAAFVSYSLMVLASFPSYSTQLIGRGLFYIPEAIRMSSLYVFDGSGYIGILLTLVYSILMGVTVSVFYTQLAMQSFSGFYDMVAFVPGVVVSGCAGCGAGILGLLGFSGVLTLLPFSGNLVRFGGIMIMVALLNRSGDPRECKV